MWMQVLAAAGLPIIGEKFPRNWAELFADANPDGFYESQLLAGIYHRTNPSPLTGAYLAPEQTRAHAVKVMIPGLVRSDVAFIDRCIATVRPWREYVASVRRLERIMGAKGGARLPPHLVWWSENFALVRDIATRRYPAHVIAYGAVLAEPERHVHEVLAWVGAGDPDRAVAAVSPTGQRSEPLPAAGERPDDLEQAQIDVFDAFYERVQAEQPLEASLIAEMNRVHDQLQPQLVEHEQRAREDALEAMLRR